MAANVVFFSSNFVEASPLKQGRLLRLRMAAKVVSFFSSNFVEASPETVQVLEVKDGGQGGLLQQRLCGGQP